MPAMPQHHVAVYSTECAKWTTVYNKFSPGGVFMQQYTSISTCQKACIGVLDGCLAVDMNNNDHDECWVHFNASYNSTAVTQASAYQYS